MKPPGMPIEELGLEHLGSVVTVRLDDGQIVDAYVKCWHASGDVDLVLISPPESVTGDS